MNEHSKGEKRNWDRAPDKFYMYVGFQECSETVL